MLQQLIQKQLTGPKQNQIYFFVESCNSFICNNSRNIKIKNISFTDYYSTCLHDRGCNCVLITQPSLHYSSEVIQGQEAAVAEMAPSLENFSSRVNYCINKKLAHQHTIQDFIHTSNRFDVKIQILFSTDKPAQDF